MAAAQLHELRQVASGLNDAPFVCGGIVDPAPRGAQAKGVSLYYHDSRGQLVELSFPPPELPALERLVAACEPATFGRGEEDVLDPAYRHSVRLDAGQFATSFNLAEFPILAEVQNLIGDSVNCVRAITHKLNVYSKGGFFKPHQDTPRNANTIGTLLVCLSTQFEGGEFVVKSADGSFTHRFDWGANAAAVNGKVQWCAFYSDCEHEVLLVRAGHRVTPTYVLEHQPVENPFTALGDHLEALLKDLSFAPQGTKLGFGLKHQYIVSKPSESREHDHALVLPLGVSMPFVKGADRMLKDTLDRLGLQYVFAPVYARSGYGRSAADLAARRYYQEEDEDRPTTYGVHFGKQVAPPTEWRFPFRTEGDPQDEWRGDDERFLFISSWNNYVDYDSFGTEHCLFDVDVYTLGLYRARDVVWIVGPTNFPYLKTGISYGNEHTLSRYYAAACLLVYIPPFHKRGIEVSRG